MELDFLYLLQNLHNDLLNTIMVFITSLGDGGIVWLSMAVVMLFFKKTRLCGITIMAGMALSLLLGNLFLKNVIARPRPCAVDPTVKLLIPYPSEYSFPSGHTLHGFTAATAIFLYFKKAGIGAFLLATAIAFSRMYLFVHYPTDILGGILLGILDAMIAYTIVQKIMRKREEKP